MQIYFIRHGHRADQMPEYAAGGNPPLSPLGRAQAEDVATFMAGQAPPTAIYASCMLRAIETAQPLVKRLGTPLHVWPVFCEATLTPWRVRYQNDPESAFRTAAWRTGKRAPTRQALQRQAEKGHYYLLSELPARFPEIVLSQPMIWPDAWWTAMEGECRESAFARIELGMEALLAMHGPDDVIVLFGHGNSGDLFLSLLLSMPRTQGRRVATHNGCVSLVALDANGERRLKYHNQVAHIHPERRT